LAGIALAALLEQLPRASRSYALAADRGQGALLVDAVAGFVDRTRGLAGARGQHHQRIRRSSSCRAPDVNAIARRPSSPTAA
jgi:hypothetical protein